VEAVVKICEGFEQVVTSDAKNPRENFVFGPKNNAPFLFDIETENLSYIS